MAGVRYGNMILEHLHWSSSWAAITAILFISDGKTIKTTMGIEKATWLARTDRFRRYFTVVKRIKKLAPIITSGATMRNVVDGV